MNAVYHTQMNDEERSLNLFVEVETGLSWSLPCRLAALPNKADDVTASALCGRLPNSSLRASTQP